MNRATTILQRTTLASIALLLCIPLLSRYVPIPKRKLEGVAMEYSAPRWSWKGIKKGKYQKGWEVWSTRDNPVWSWSIALTNEMIYRLTGELSLDYVTSIQGGREGHFWQPMYLKSFNGTRKPEAARIQQTFAQLAQAQQLLAKHNIPLIALINPNVLHLYPELIPDKFKAIQPGPKDYDIASEAIESSKAQVVDLFAYLKEVQPNFPMRFFEPTGSHWNDVASCLAVKALSPKLASSWHDTIPDPQCEKYTMEFPPRPADTDLVAIANLLKPRAYLRPAPYVQSPVHATLQKPRKILLVGTSFLFAIEKELLRRKIADSTTLLFYFKQVRKDGTGNFYGFDRRKITKEFLLRYDAIIVDANVSAPGSMGRGSLPVIINQLLKDESGNVDHGKASQ
jgi:hypothetical protein